jgi:membrane protein
MQPSRIVSLAKAAIAAWSEDYAPSMGAALAYYTLFSIAPLLLIAISIAGLVFGEQAARGEIFGELRGLVGEDGAHAAQALLQSVARPARGIGATAVGTVVLAVGAMSVFGELQNALDRIWRVAAPPGGSNLRQLLRTRLLSFVMVLGIGMLLLASLAASAAISALGRRWAAAGSDWEPFAHAIDAVLAFVLVTLAFALLYKVVPRVRIEWHDVWVGAMVTAALFVVGKFAIGLYLGRASFASGYGAAGSLVVLLAWMYWSAQIFLLGAEFTRIYARTCGSHCPSPGAATGSTAESAISAVAASRAAIAAVLAETGRR